MFAAFVAVGLGSPVACTSFVDEIACVPTGAFAMGEQEPGAEPGGAEPDNELGSTAAGNSG